MLQWVHGRKTVVLTAIRVWSRSPFRSFNGSTVGKPWFCTGEDPGTEQFVMLQWVHGRKTVVLTVKRICCVANGELQWVHGRKTVVLEAEAWAAWHKSKASMGPRSENRGFGPRLEA